MKKLSKSFLKVLRIHCDEVHRHVVSKVGHKKHLPGGGRELTFYKACIHLASG